MESSTGFLQQMSYFTGEPLNKLNNIGANLRASNKIRKGGRRYDPHYIDAKEAAVIFIAVLGTERAKDASIVVDRLYDMPIVQGSMEDLGLNIDPLPTTFGETIEMLLSDSSVGLAPNTVQVSRTYPKAVITWHRYGKTLPIEFMPNDTTHENYTHSVEQAKNFMVAVVLLGRIVRVLADCIKNKIPVEEK